MEAPHDRDGKRERPLGFLDGVVKWAAFAALAGFVGVAAFFELQVEAVRWQAADAYAVALSAYERDEQGRIDETRRVDRLGEAIDRLREVVGDAPSSRWRRLELAWLIEADRYDEAVTLADALLAEDADDAFAYVSRLQCAVALQDAATVAQLCESLQTRFGDARSLFTPVVGVASYDDPATGDSRPIYVDNQTAYSSAVSNVRLVKAEKEIDRLLDVFRSNAGGVEPGSLVDTHALVLLRQGKTAKALKRFDEAIAFVESESMTDFSIGPPDEDGNPVGALEQVRRYRRRAIEAFARDQAPDSAN